MNITTMENIARAQWNLTDIERSVLSGRIA